VDTQDDQVQVLEALLGISLPTSYVTFLLERGSAIVNGLPLLGFPLNLETSSVWGATELVRAYRPDLKPDPKYFVAIRLLDTRALCLDLRQESQDDAPLVESSEVRCYSIYSLLKYIPFWFSLRTGKSDCQAPKT